MATSSLYRVLQWLTLLLVPSTSLMWMLGYLENTGAWSLLLRSVAVVAFLTWYVTTYWMPVCANLPPGPPRIPWPFDIILNILTPGTPLQKVMKLTEAYGDMVFIHGGSQKILILSSPDLVNEVVVANQDVSTSREYIPLMSSLVPYDKAGIVFSNGQVWLDNRRFLLKALRHFGVGKQSFDETFIAPAVSKMCAEVESRRDHRVSINPLLRKTLANVNSLLMLGHSSETDKTFYDAIDAVTKLFEGEIGVIGEMFVLFGRSQPVARLVKSVIEREIQEHVATFDEKRIRDVIDLYLLELRELEGKTTSLSREHMWGLFFDVLLAATETTTFGLQWPMLYLAAYPEIQTKVFKEASEAIAPNKTPSYREHIGKMPYTQAFLQETHRHRPVIPNIAPHLTTKDMEIRGYRIPKGTAISKNVMTVNHNKEFWKDPDVFRPERFLSQDGKSFVPDSAFMSFGAGRRLCPGELLARSEIFTVIMIFVRQFMFRLPDDVDADFSFEHRVTTIGPNDYEMVVERR